MKKSFLALAILVSSSIAIPAFAQDLPGRTSESYATEAALQYSMLRDYGSTGSFGMLVDFGKQIRPNLSVVGELGMHRVAGYGYTQGAAGLRLGKMTSAKIRSFVQFAAGPQHEWGATGFVFQPGGGVNIRATKKVDLKVQADFPILQWRGHTYKQFRMSVGLGLPFGGK